MKVFMIILYLFGIVAYGQDINNDELRVFGLGEHEVSCDLAKLNFSIETFGSTLNEAANKGDKIISAIVDSLFKIGLTSEDIETNSYWSGNAKDPAFWSSSQDYNTVMSIYISTKKLSLLDDVILLLSQFNIKEISSINFSVSDPNKHKIEATNKALENARLKAEMFSKKLNLKLGKVVLAEELATSQKGDFVIIPHRGNTATVNQMRTAVNNRTTYFGKKVNYISGVQIIYSFKQ